MRGLVIPSTLLLALLVFATSLSAATWYVKQDHTGDAPTIQAAADSSAPGDTILLANGTFTGDGNRDIRLYDQSFIIMSESLNPDLCVIDCEGTASENHQGFDVRFTGDPPVMIVGVTIRGGYTSSAGAIYVGTNGDGQGRLGLVNCVLTGNTASTGGAMMVFDSCYAGLVNTNVTGNSSSSGGAIYLSYNSALTITGGAISDNGADYNGGAIISYGGVVMASSCTFSGNTAAHYGGAIHGEQGAALSLTSCTLSGNSGSFGGGAIRFEGGEVSLLGCTSMHNSSQYGASLNCAGTLTLLVSGCSFVADSSGFQVVWLGPDVSATINGTVIAFAREAGSVYCGGGGAPEVTCSDFFGNQYGDWTGCVADEAGTDGNISEDPLFCDLAGGSVTVEGCSPCLAANNTCGLDIGAGGPGCACGEATQPTTWGALKALYK